MEIDIRFVGMERSPAFVEYARRRAEHFLGRLGRSVSRVVLRVSELGGRRGGKDKRCQLAISGPELGTVVLVEAQGDVYTAAELALYRARHVLGEELSKGQERGGGGRRGAQGARLRLVRDAGG